MKYIQHQIKDILYPDTSLYQILKLPHHCHLPFTLVQIQLSGNARSCSRVDCQHELITCSENPAQLFSLLHALCRQFLFQGCCYTIAGSVIILVVKEKEKKKNYFKRRIDAGRCWILWWMKRRWMSHFLQTYTSLLVIHPRKGHILTYFF